METVTATAPPPARALFKSMLQGSGLYMLATLGVRLASFILVPVVTRHLTTADYGVMDLLEQVGVITSVVLGLNFSSGLGFFYFEAGSVKREVVGTTLAGSLMLGAIAGLLAFVLSGPIGKAVFHSSDYQIYLWLIFACMPVNFLLEAGLGWLRVENRAVLYASAVLLRVCLVIVGTLTLILGFHLKIGGVLGSNVSAVTLTAIAVTATAFYHYRPAFNPVLFKRMLRFALPLCLSACGLFIIHFGDRFILPRYRSFADLGIYAAAYKFGMLLSPIQAAFESYWCSQVFGILKRSDARNVFARVFTYWLAILSFCALGLLVATPPMLHKMLPPSYYGALSIAPIVLGAYYVRAIGDFFRHLFIANGLPAYDATCNWITAGISLASYFLLIPPFGIMGAAIATLVTFALAGVMSVIWSRRVWPYHVDLARVGKLISVTVVLSAIHFAIPSSSFFIDIAVGAALLAAFPLILWVWRFPTLSEKELLRSSVARLMRSRA
jgi:O-antigen/teichoic acid export membrane protein